jgi:hypothetical protein
MYIMVTLYWGNMIILWLFHLGISCTVFVFICIMVALNCFVMCVCVCVWGGCKCVGVLIMCILWISSATLTAVFPCFFLVVRQMLGYNSQRLGTANTLPDLLFVLFFCSCCFVVNCLLLFVCKCVLPPGVNPIAVDKYININTTDFNEISFLTLD